MSNHIYVHISVSGPAKSVEAWIERMRSARQSFLDGKGSYWAEAFGLFHPYATVEPKLSDTKLADHPPPGESYATLQGYWSSRQWTPTEVVVAFGTIASLFPELTIYFGGDHYEEVGMRGLWINGKCVVFDVCDPVDGPLTAEDVDRLVRSASTIPDYYAPFFEFAKLPEWDDIRKSIYIEQIDDERRADQ